MRHTPRQICKAVLAAAMMAGGLAWPVLADGDAPRRVVSVNLCTDQLAMALAAPGQLISVSYLAADPAYSLMVDQARDYPANMVLAEDVYLLRPDLVLAGSFTSPATLSMLERLGIPVLRVEPAYALADVRAGIVQMGAALHREAEAAAMLAAFDARLAAMTPAPAAARPTAATYAAQGYTSGRSSLAGDIIEAAGLHHLAEELGFAHGGFLPLEALVMADPDLVVTGEKHSGHSRADDLLDHPALKALGGGRDAIEGREWICGLPQVLDAVDRLADIRRGLVPRADAATAAPGWGG
jgi:iron complex transport system substrate-binding protein